MAEPTHAGQGCCQVTERDGTCQVLGTEAGIQQMLAK